jgi:hypothetical protein
VGYASHGAILHYNRPMAQIDGHGLLLIDAGRFLVLHDVDVHIYFISVFFYFINFIYLFIYLFIYVLLFIVSRYCCFQAFKFPCRVIYFVYVLSMISANSKAVSTGASVRTLPAPFLSVACSVPNND